MENKSRWKKAKDRIKNMKLEDLEQFRQYFSDEKFTSKISSVVGFLGESVVMPIFRIYYLLKSDQVELKHKLYIVGALGYFILPFDLIPDFLGPLGYTDDLAVVGIVLKVLKNQMTDEIEMQARSAYESFKLKASHR